MRYRSQKTRVTRRHRRPVKWESTRICCGHGAGNRARRQHRWGLTNVLRVKLARFMVVKDRLNVLHQRRLRDVTFGGGCQPNSHEIHPADLQRVSERGHQLPQVARMHEYRNCTRKKCPQSQRPSTQTRHLGKRSLLCLARLRVRQGVGVELYSDTHGVPCIGVVRRCVLHAKESQCRQGGGVPGVPRKSVVGVLPGTAQWLFWQSYWQR